MSALNLTPPFAVFRHGDEWGVEDSAGRIVRSGLDDASAEMIVRAVNTHAELVADLSALLKFAEGFGGRPAHEKLKSRAAKTLAKAQP